MSEITFKARTRIEDDAGKYQATVERLKWNSAKTAVVVCDMWNKHWCKGATRRVAEMAPQADKFLKIARGKGMLIIHAPSETLGFYKDTPQRRLAQQAPKLKPSIPLKLSCKLDPGREGELPIDDSDGGCDCEPQCETTIAWNRQIETIEIAKGDAITDSDEAFYLMKQRGIENVIILGVHTNMCVLGRPFSIRQMCYQGRNVALVRDLTDAMYNSRKAPFVSHFEGTDLVIEHIEKHWCPTITSADLIGGEPFTFANDTRKKD
ncbi:MAG: protein-signal peptide and transmembrane prediction [Planctomycetota bacterium]|jgi:nicotinamidase-related amidase|nr:protein-signal peptide and transmembrane prediction [Planctomycetota bacterium]